MYKLKNVVAYITGGASGIGKAVAERIICQGGRVCIADANPEGCNYAKSLGEKAMFFLTDVTQECDVLDSLNQTKECFGKIDTVVNAAGIVKYEPIYDFKNEIPHSEESFKRQFDINVWGTFNVIRLAAGVMAKNKPNENKDRGIIVNLASMMAFEPPPGLVAYGGTKSAVAGMTLPLARGLSSKGIRVIGICPGYIDSNMTNKDSEEEKKLRISMKLAPKRYGTCDEVAHLIQAVIENPVMNGENIRIDSGYRYSQINDSLDITEPSC